MNRPERLKRAGIMMCARIGERPCAAVVSILAPVMLFLIGSATSLIPWHAAATPEHPLFIALVMNIVTAIIWLAHEYIPVAKRPRLRSSLWGATFLVNWIFAVILFILEFPIPGPHAPILQALALGIPLLLLCLVAFIPLQKDAPDSSTAHSGAADNSRESPGPQEIRQWGFALALVIMLLALFAFGVHYGDEAKSRGLINWVEIPAILIVFVLADLGVNLVALAKSVEASTTGAAGRAGEAVTALQSATEQLTSAGNKAEQCLGELKTALEAFEAVQNQLLVDNTTPLNRTLHDYVLLHNAKEYWGRLFCFGRSWVPAGLKAESETKAKRRLLGALFGEFVGANEENGCVRRADNDVICVTLDAAFAQASKKWLDTLEPSSGNGLVIWAVTTLLPTEFAFPQLYWGGDAASAKRAEALRDFVGKVLEQCGSRKVREYRRVSVFRGSDGEKLRTHQENGCHCILDCLYLLDKRLPGSEDQSHDQSAMWQELANPKGLRESLGGDELNGRFSVLPLCPETVKPGSFVVHRDNRIEMRVCVSDSPPTGTGWLRLREWYCDRLHKSPGIRQQQQEEVAWWSVLDESDEAAQLLKPFALDCGGFTVYTLDLLMIGEPGKDGDDIWHAAAISNISFDRTECTVRVITGEGDLKKIAEAVRGFCNGFKAPEGEQVPAGVKAFGTWRQWPKAIWQRV